MVALSLVGSAILLFSCGAADEADKGDGDEGLMTEYSENLSIVMSQNGRRSYVFVTPLVEGYSLAREPYQEFRKGVKITTFQDDSLTVVDAVLTANYAIYYKNRQLWEAKGNVVVVKADGSELYTQQLFWNAQTKRIYSNVDTKVLQKGYLGVGEGFESDEEFKDWRFRKGESQMEVDATPRDSTQVATPSDTPPPPASKPEATPDPKPRPAPRREATPRPASPRPAGAAQLQLQRNDQNTQAQIQPLHPEELQRQDDKPQTR